MAIRTATAGTLDTAITNLFSALDSYLLLRKQPGETADAAEKYFWRVMSHKFRERETMERLITSGYLPRPIAVLQHPCTNRVTGAMCDLMTEWNTEVGAWCSKQIKTLQEAGDADLAEDAASGPEEPGPPNSVTEVLRKSIILVPCRWRCVA